MHPWPSARQVCGLAWLPFPQAGTSLSVLSDILTAHRPALLAEATAWVPLPPSLQSETFTSALSLESGCTHTHAHPSCEGILHMQVLVSDPERCIRHHFRVPAGGFCNTYCTSSRVLRRCFFGPDVSLTTRSPCFCKNSNMSCALLGK